MARTVKMKFSPTNNFRLFVAPPMHVGGKRKSCHHGIPLVNGFHKTTLFRASFLFWKFMVCFVFFPSHWLHLVAFPHLLVLSRLIVRLKTEWEEPVLEPLLEGTTQAFFSLHYNQSQGKKGEEKGRFNSFQGHCRQSWRWAVPLEPWTCNPHASQSSLILEPERERYTDTN